MFLAASAAAVEANPTQTSDERLSSGAEARIRLAGIGTTKVVP